MQTFTKKYFKQNTIWWPIIMAVAKISLWGFFQLEIIVSKILWKLGSMICLILEPWIAVTSLYKFKYNPRSCFNWSICILWKYERQSQLNILQCVNQHNISVSNLQIIANEQHFFLPFSDENTFFHKNPCCNIVNPVSLAGKWWIYTHSFYTDLLIWRNKIIGVEDRTEGTQSYLNSCVQ